MLKPITYKKVLDKTGALEYLEIVQGDEVIKVSLAPVDVHRSGCRWEEIRETVDKLVAQARTEAEAVANDSEFNKVWQQAIKEAR